MNLSTKGRPTARCVLVEGTTSAPTFVEAFDLTSSNDTLPEQLHDLATGLRSRLSGLKPDRVVVRRADVPPKPSNKEGPRLRLLAEGALVAAAMDEVRSVTVVPGKDLAAMAGYDKAGLDDHAAASLPTAPLEAAAAAIVGLA